MKHIYSNSKSVAKVRQFAQSPGNRESSEGIAASGGSTDRFWNSWPLQLSGMELLWAG